MRLSELIKLIEEGKQPKEIIEYNDDSEAVYKWDCDKGYVVKGTSYKLIKDEFLFDLIYNSTFRGVSNILDDKEKEYLSNVIKPFRGNINYIVKEKLTSGNYYIHIDHKTCFIDLPGFTPEDNMYNGMELRKEYTLEELGL